jgi:hypothetical protein
VLPLAPTAMATTTLAATGTTISGRPQNLAAAVNIGKVVIAGSSASVDHQAPVPHRSTSHSIARRREHSNGRPLDHLIQPDL